MITLIFTKVFGHIEYIKKKTESKLRHPKAKRSIVWIPHSIVVNRRIRLNLIIHEWKAFLLLRYISLNLFGLLDGTLIAILIFHFLRPLTGCFFEFRVKVFFRERIKESSSFFETFDDDLGRGELNPQSFGSSHVCDILVNNEVYKHLSNLNRVVNTLMGIMARLLFLEFRFGILNIIFASKFFDYKKRSESHSYA